MTVARNVQSDLEAIAAMPGLEELADVFAPHVRRFEDALALVVFLAGQWGLGSRNELTSVFKNTSTWSEMRASAERVGRRLPASPPTHDRLRHMRDAAGAGVGAALAEAFVAASAPLVRSVGLLSSDTNARWHRPDRRHVVYGDGTTFKPLSEVYVDPETGEVLNSRSRGVQGPRIAKRFYGKKEGAVGIAGLPLTLMGAHGGERWQRVVLAVGLHFDRDELGSAMALFARVHDVYGSGVHALAYDRLMGGRAMRDVMRRGVVPIVDMPEASTGLSLTLPDELRFVCGRKGQPKNQAVLRQLETVTHSTADGECAHVLWALDGAIVTCTPQELRPTVESTVVPQTSMQFIRDEEGTTRLIGTYRVPCRHGSVVYRLDLSGDRVGTSRNGDNAMADWVRPLDLTAELDQVRGYRSDVESTFRTLKNELELFGRAGSLEPDHFLLDAVGAALHVNAVAWDVHAARHTRCGQQCARSVISSRQRGGA